MTDVPSQFWVVRKDDTTVAKYDTPGEDPQIPVEIDEQDRFTVHGLDDREALENEEVDESVLDDSDREILGIPPEM